MTWSGSADGRWPGTCYAHIGRIRLWVPRILLLALTWFYVFALGRRVRGSGGAGTFRSGTVSTRVTTIDLFWRCSHAPPAPARIRDRGGRAAVPRRPRRHAQRVGLRPRLARHPPGHARPRAGRHRAR